MKRCLPLFVAGLSLAVLAGCGGESSTPDSASATNSSGGNPVAAPVDYLGAVAKGQQSAIKTIDTAQLKQAIQNFQIAEDRLPASLDELVAKGYLREIPAAPNGMKIQYDPKTGAVAVVKM